MILHPCTVLQYSTYENRRKILRIGKIGVAACMDPFRLAFHPSTLHLSSQAKQSKIVGNENDSWSESEHPRCRHEKTPMEPRAKLEERIPNIFSIACKATVSTAQLCSSFHRTVPSFKFVHEIRTGCRPRNQSSTQIAWRNSKKKSDTNRQTKPGSGKSAHLLHIYSRIPTHKLTLINGAAHRDQ